MSQSQWTTSGQKINKWKAMEAIKEGKRVRLIPCELNPDHDRNPHVDVWLSRLERLSEQAGAETLSDQLDYAVNATRFALCKKNRGYHILYYIKE